MTIKCIFIDYVCAANSCQTSPCPSGTVCFEHSTGYQCVRPLPPSPPPEGCGSPTHAPVTPSTDPVTPALETTVELTTADVSTTVSDTSEDCVKRLGARFRNRPYAYDVTEGRPRALGVKRGTATCAIAKHAARGPTPACHTAGLARARALTERLSANALCQHCSASLDPQHGAVVMETWRQCIRSIENFDLFMLITIL